MLQNQLKNPLQYSTLVNRFPQFLVTVIATGATILGCLSTGATAGEPVAATASTSTANLQAQTTATPANLPDGVYLYGQATEPDQIGQGYFVFESIQGKVVGALYMPRSSFDCAAGTFKDDQLALTVVNSYDRTTNPFEIALERTSTVAANGKPTIDVVGLQGFQRISKISENDHRMLQICKTDMAKRGQ